MGTIPTDRYTASNQTRDSEEPLIVSLALFINIISAFYIICFGILLAPGLFSWCGNETQNFGLNLFIAMPLAVLLSWLLTVLTPSNHKTYILIRFLSIITTCAYLTLIVLVFTFKP